MKYFVGFIVGTFAMGIVLAFKPVPVSIPEDCSDAFYSLTAAHVVTVERMLENDLDAALISVQYGVDAVDQWEEKCN